MSYIKYEQNGFVGVLTIDREKALNALNSEVLADLDAALDAIDLDSTRCLIITGAGQKSFVAGADIGEMSTLTKRQCGGAFSVQLCFCTFHFFLDILSILCFNTLVVSYSSN